MWMVLFPRAEMYVIWMLDPFILFSVSDTGINGLLTKVHGKRVQKATPEMGELLKELRKRYTIGIVGGSDLSKQAEQLGDGCMLQ
jgi:hypothetical protein